MKSRFRFAAAFLFGAVLLPVTAWAADPVDALQQALPLRLIDMANPTPQVIEHRRETLSEKVAALRTIGQLRRALALDEWKEDPTQVINEKLRRIDADMRRQVGERLAKSLEEVARSGEPSARLAVANLLAEMGPTVRAVDPAELGGYARTLTPVVLQLVADKDRGVRQEALRALGNINPRPADAAPVFARTLRTDETQPRRLAAEGLAQLVRVAAHLHKRGRSAAGVEASRPEVLAAAKAAVPPAAEGLKDPDPVVRRHALQALETAAQALYDLAPQAFAAKDFPPAGRRLNAEETQDILAKQAKVRAEIAEAAPLFRAFRERIEPLAATLRDPDPGVRRQAADALERIASARLRFRTYMASVPQIAGAADAGAPLAEVDPLAPLLPKLQDLAPLLEDSDIHLRRALLYFLESLESQAAPLTPALTSRLSDEDRFVRWAAARVLAGLPTDTLKEAVPDLGRLLSDPDLNVRLAAAAALENLGPQAREAVPLLAAAVIRGDVEGRVAAMKALTALGAAAQPAVPQLAEVLSHPESRVRAQAALTLGNLGPTARAALPALRRALGDSSSEVRVNAGDAILNILSP